MEGEKAGKLSHSLIYCYAVPRKRIFETQPIASSPDDYGTLENMTQMMPSEVLVLLKVGPWTPT